MFFLKYIKKLKNNEKLFYNLMYLKALWGGGSEKKAFIYFYLLNIILIIRINIQFYSNCFVHRFLPTSTIQYTNCLSFGKHS
jgi:hypothetical protein